jgi:hypothetical protein
MALEPATRAQLFKTLRLWLLALICAGVGAYVVGRSNDVGTGIGAFLIAFVVFGLPLWAYERSLTRRTEKPPAPPRPGRR